MNFNIIKATVIQTGGPATFPYEGNECFRITAAADSGAEYVRKHFNIEPLVIARI